METKAPQILVSPGTPLACTRCHRVGMDTYYLKRSNGKYDVLCVDEGRGCWEHSMLVPCSFIDRDEAQCPDVAEWLVVYGNQIDKVRVAVCSRHVAAVLGGSPEYRVYPLDDALAARTSVESLELPASGPVLAPEPTLTA